MVEISVTDTGCGIPQANLRRIFDAAEGSCFLVSLPCRRAGDRPPPAAAA